MQLNARDFKMPDAMNRAGWWTEYALQMGRLPSGRIVLRAWRRTASSADPVFMATSEGHAWTAAELADVFARFEQSVREQLILTVGLQLTLSLDGLEEHTEP